MKKCISVFILIIGLLCTDVSHAFAATTVTNFSPTATNVAKYGKFEATFSLSRTFPSGSFLPYYYYDAADTPARYPGRKSPYGVDGISIDAHFTSPSGKALTLPAFYYQEYMRSGDTMTPTQEYFWKIRFTPKEVGTYTYYLTITDKDGTGRYPTSGALTMNATASSAKGFVRVSPRDGRFFEFENGTSFVPNSSGRQYWRNGQRASFYEQSFAEFAQYGINFTRIWDQNDGYGLTVEGHFDGYKWPDDYKPDTDAIAAALPKGTQMNQRGNYDEDKIFESAEKNGVYIELSSKGEPYWIWDASIYDEPWNANPRNWTDTEHMNYWKRNYRYRIARWGYSPAIATWEVWNEHGHISSGSDVWNFYAQLSQYIKETDPFDHLVTTSQGSQAWSPGFWSTPGMDVVNYHDYMMPGRYPDNLVYDAAHFVYRFMQCLRLPNGANCGLDLGDGSTASGAQKPIIWGELDTGTSNWNEPNHQQKATHDMRWAGLFSPAGTTGIDWYWDSASAAFTLTKHKEAKIASDFFKDVDYAGKKFTYLATSDIVLPGTGTVSTTGNLRALVMRAQNAQEAFVWAQNKANARWNQAVNTAATTGVVSIPGMNNGNYTVETWDTYTGTKSTTTLSVTGGTAQVSVNNLSKDVAIKVISTTLPPPTQTPVPTIPPTATPAPTGMSKPGDGNADNKVDGIDYVLWLNNFGITTTSGPAKGDYNRDTKVDGIDYVLWLNNFGM